MDSGRAPIRLPPPRSTSVEQKCSLSVGPVVGNFHLPDLHFPCPLLKARRSLGKWPSTVQSFWSHPVVSARRKEALTKSWGLWCPQKAPRRLTHGLGLLRPRLRRRRRPATGRRRLRRPAAGLFAAVAEEPGRSARARRSCPCGLVHRSTRSKAIRTGRLRHLRRRLEVLQIRKGLRRLIFLTVHLEHHGCSGRWTGSGEQLDLALVEMKLIKV